jgi:hypothetical protein
MGWESLDSERAAFMTRHKRDLYELELWSASTCLKRATMTRNRAQMVAGLWCDMGRMEMNAGLARTA